MYAHCKKREKNVFEYLCFCESPFKKCQVCKRTSDGQDLCLIFLGVMEEHYNVYNFRLVSEINFDKVGIHLVILGCLLAPILSLVKGKYVSFIRIHTKLSTLYIKIHRKLVLPTQYFLVGCAEFYTASCISVPF